MKNSLLYFLIIYLLSCHSNKMMNEQNFINKKQLIGTWEYIEMRNSKGEKIESYDLSFGEIKASGPEIKLMNDGTYMKKFTPTNTDYGFWKYNPKQMTIEYDLFIDSTDWIGKDLIKKGLAIKQKDGNYYEKIEDKILEFKNDTMILNNRGYKIVYKKTQT